MALVPVTAANVETSQSMTAMRRSGHAAAAITRGQAVYLTTAGLVGVASAGAAGTAGYAGIATSDAAAGQRVDYIEKGLVEGFTLTALDFGALVYLGDTAGTLDTAAGTVSTVVGRVDQVTLSTGPVKVLNTKSVYV